MAGGGGGGGGGGRGRGTGEEEGEEGGKDRRGREKDGMKKKGSQLN